MAFFFSRDRPCHVDAQTNRMIQNFTINDRYSLHPTSCSISPTLPFATYIRESAWNVPLLESANGDVATLRLREVVITVVPGCGINKKHHCKGDECAHIGEESWDLRIRGFAIYSWGGS